MPNLFLLILHVIKLTLKANSFQWIKIVSFLIFYFLCLIVLSSKRWAFPEILQFLCFFINSIINQHKYSMILENCKIVASILLHLISWMESLLFLLFAFWSLSVFFIAVFSLFFSFAGSCFNSRIVAFFSVHFWHVIDSSNLMQLPSVSTL